MKKIGLSELIFPVTAKEFFESYWPHKPLFISGSSEKANEKRLPILDIPELHSLESLIAARTLKVRACLPDFDDEYSSITLESKDAIKAYRNQMTLVFDSMHLQNKLIAECLENIRQDLGLLTGGIDNDLCRARSMAYATPAGCGTRMHFDANANFILQIHGSKRWTLAPNRSVVNPTERFTTGADQMSLALESQFHAELPNEMPHESTDYSMQPGCLLYVPRGYWHSTDAQDDSLSLNFTFSEPTWADVFTKSLQEHLLKSAQWRGLADGLGGKDEARLKKGVQKFKSLFKNLQRELLELPAEELLKLIISELE